MTAHLKAITDFFDHIGLDYRMTPVRADSFMPGMDIQNGVLLIDTKSLVHVGDLLHEAGHIAITAQDTRQRLQGDVTNLHGPGDEMAAIAWSWAALKYIGLKPEVVFHPAGYKQASQSIIEAFENSSGFGVPLLVYWQMCLEPIRDTQGFPNMAEWLRKA